MLSESKSVERSDVVPKTRRGTRLTLPRGWHIPLLSCAAGLAGIVGLLFVREGIPSFWILVLSTTFAWIAVGVGVNILLGMSGMFMVHAAATMAVSAYSLAILVDQGMAYPVAFIVAIVLSSIATALLMAPALRLEGFYLAIVSFIGVLFTQWVINEWEPLTGGSFGFHVRGPILGPLSSLESVMALAGATAVVALTLYALIGRSTFGARLRACRDSATAARSSGLSLGWTRFRAVLVSNIFVGAGGAWLGTASQVLHPDQYGLSKIIDTIFVAWFGGLDRTLAPVLGAALVSALPSWAAGLREYAVLFTQTILLVLIVLLPNGVLSVTRSGRRKAVLR